MPLLDDQPPRPPGLLLEPGPPGAWDDERISGPCVLCGPDGTWRMWYYGRDRTFGSAVNLPTGRCGLALSADGLTWERVVGPLTRGAVFEPHPDPDRFDSLHLGVSQVEFRDGHYRMWYFGGDHARQQFGPFAVTGFNMLPGLAVSPDGVDWTRVEGPWRGAWLGPGQPGAPDAVMCAWPQVLHGPDGVWRLYYHSLDPERLVFVISLAESPDGRDWTRRGAILSPGEPGAFDAGGVGARHVLRHDDRYLMFYSGLNPQGYHSIGLATSSDGVHWERQPGPEPDGSVFAHAPPGSGRWDAYMVSTPCVLPMPDGSFRLYYVGVGEAATGYTDELALRQRIGLALSDGPDFTRWQRW
jgi:hypothetical protein